MTGRRTAVRQRMCPDRPRRSEHRGAGLPTLPESTATHRAMPPAASPIAAPMPAATDDVRVIAWPHGRAELQRLGGMLAPVRFVAPGHAPFEPLQVAPWADEPQPAGQPPLPGILRRLRGEWPCVPFGRSDRPAGLPPGWTSIDAGDGWGHGYASHHDWRWLAGDDPLSLRLQIDLPADSPIARLTRSVRAMPDAPRLEVRLQIEARHACTLPVALHPTLRLDAGRVALSLAHDGPGFTYPVQAEPSSRLQADARFERLSAVPLAAGGSVDLSRYPQSVDSEELLQLTAVRGPVQAHYLDRGWTLTLDWDHAALPDLMLWVSHRGRPMPPWNGRHWALGLEPVHGGFDLGRVAAPPADHPLADRQGLRLAAGERREIAYGFQAAPHDGGAQPWA